MTTSFTYQGQIKLAGVPVNAPADFYFSVWDASAGGQQVGSPYQVNGVDVKNGLFAVLVNCGSNVFAGEARWIDVLVRYPTGQGYFVQLTPRQPIQPAPYALYSKDTRGIYVATDGKVGLGVTNPGHRLEVLGVTKLNAAYGPHLIIHDTNGGSDRPGIQFTNNNLQYFAGDDLSDEIFSFMPGYGTSQAHDAIVYIYGDTGGVNAAARVLSLTHDGTDARIGTSTGHLLLNPTGNVGVATASPAHKLDVAGAGRFATNAGPNLVIHDANGSNDRPGIQFTNNTVHYIGGDDASNETFGFYSQYGNMRAYDAVVAIYGNTQGTTGTWGRQLALTHDGSDGKITTDAGHLLLQPAGGRVGIGTTTPKQTLHNAGEYYGKGHLWLYAYQGDGQSGTAYVQARDDSGTSSIDLQLRTQRGGAVVDAMKLASSGAVGIGTTTPDADARLRVNSLALVAPSEDWAAHFKDANGTGEAWLAGDDGQGRQYGIEAQGSKAAGFFHNTAGVGEARIAYDDNSPDGEFGIWARGKTGGYFESSATNAAKAWICGPNTSLAAVVGASNKGGAYFEDLDESGWAAVGTITYKIIGNGSVNFVQNHPEDASRVIVYTAPEGDETATYTRGSARLTRGQAVVPLGDTFKWVTNPDIGLTAHLTPRGECKGLFVASLTTREMTVRELGGGESDAAFDYLVYGLRIGFEETGVVQPKSQEAALPSMSAHQRMYADEPELQRYNAIERYKAMRADVASTPPDFSASAELLRAVGTAAQPEARGAAMGTAAAQADVADSVAVDHAPEPIEAIARRVAALRTELDRLSAELRSLDPTGSDPPARR